MTTTIEIGHNVRHWTTYKVIGELTPTEEEILTDENASEHEILDVLSALLDDGRVEIQSSRDKGTDPLDGYNDPSVIKVVRNEEVVWP